MSAAFTSPTRPSPSDLQSHLYASFLQRKTADVALRISGSWHAVYSLHRVILIQAGFFQSLFTSGFSESNSKLSGHQPKQDCIDIVFDDPNITRAAFEICIARLYGGGPNLWISPSLIPTATHPLTPSFASTVPEYPPKQSSSLLPPSLDISSAPTLPPGHHPATPRFLLSLLATAVFLSMPSVASQALSAIVRTVGPHTCVRYLNFAIGRGVGSSVDPGTGNKGVDYETEAAAGLEDVAELVHEEDPLSSYGSIDVTMDLRHRHEHERTPSPTPSSTMKKPSKHSPSCGGPPDSDSEPDIDTDDHTTGELPVGPSTGRKERCYYYGAVSDKVGEIATCWLTRWGIDMLRLEEQEITSLANQGVKSRDVRWSSMSPQTQAAGQRPGSPPEMAAAGVSRRSGKPAVVPIVWRRGGLSARWIRGILSSDALFVRGEKERYEMAKSIVEMRRTARTIDPDPTGELEEVEEAEFDRLFQECIYYVNMNLDELMAISRDVSPSTGKPIVPLADLQAALWNQSTLYHRIISRSATDSPMTLSPTSATKELGVGVASAEIVELALHPEDRSNAFYPIPADSSLRLGDSTGIEGAESMDQLFNLGDMKLCPSQATEANFFGHEQSRLPASAFTSPPTSIPPTLTDAETKWTPHPPFRFAVEFWDVDALKEKSRLHSHTIWYAGSLYNVYVQVVRKKGVQLGIYLHRQSSVDSIPASSAPVSGIPSSPFRDRNATGRGSSSSVSSPRSPYAANLDFGPISSIASSASMSSLARQTVMTAPPSPATPISAASLPSAPSLLGSPTTLHSPFSSVGPLSTTSIIPIPATAPPLAPSQPYRDPRPAVGAYFTISCASATGASLTRFTSAPDTFSVSQSWGWKSSSLRTEEYLELDTEGPPASVIMPAGREVSLRVTVVLGVV